ncbi:MAG: hypothetical protein R3B81_05885 [bacterium]
MLGKNQRRVVLVNKRVQARIILSTSLPMIGCLVFAVVVELFYQRQIDLGRIAPGGTIFGMPSERLGMLLMFVSAATTQLVTALLASQKVAGTSYRIAQTLNEYRSGNRAIRVHLRKGDFQQNLAHDLNDFLDWSNREFEGGNSNIPRKTATSPQPSVPGVRAGDARGKDGAKC